MLEQRGFSLKIVWAYLARHLVLEFLKKSGKKDYHYHYYMRQQTK